MSDKFSATWVSHSSISDYLNCPRLYYLNNVYKDPKSGNKISLISPPLALGQAVHETLESLSILPADVRFKDPLMPKFNKNWEKVSGEKGGFTTEEEEQKYKSRGESMIKRVINNPGPLEGLAVKINTDLPNYWLSEDDAIILCGKIDWLKYNKSDDSVEIIDFKTSKTKQSDNSLQLPIYYLLATNTQSRSVTGAHYWYLDFDNRPTSVDLPDISEAKSKILKIAKDIKLARALERFKCSSGSSGCRHCKPFEKIISGDATYVGLSSIGQDLYTVSLSDNDSSRIL